MDMTYYTNEYETGHRQGWDDYWDGKRRQTFAHAPQFIRRHYGEGYNAGWRAAEAYKREY